MIFNAWKLNKKDVNVTHCLRLTLGQVITADMLTEPRLSSTRTKFSLTINGEKILRTQKKTKEEEKAIAVYI